MTLQVGGVFSWIKKLFQHIFHFLFKFRVFFSPKSMFQFKKSILFSINPDSLLRLWVLKMRKILKESSKVRSGLKAKKLRFVLIFSLPLFFCREHVGIHLPFNSSHPLWWNGSIFFTLQGKSSNILLQPFPEFLPPLRMFADTPTASSATHWKRVISYLL